MSRPNKQKAAEGWLSFESLPPIEELVELMGDDFRGDWTAFGMRVETRGRKCGWKWMLQTMTGLKAFDERELEHWRPCPNAALRVEGKKGDSND